MPTTPLPQLATIRSGYHYRSRIVADERGEWRVAQGREVRADLSWAIEAMPRVNPGPAARRARLAPGDVLVLARGERPYALTVPDWAWPALASSSFYVIRIRQDRLIPEYLAWWLNTDAVVARLVAGMRGSKIRWLPRDALLALEIDMPATVRQQEIAEAAALAAEESRLHGELSREREGSLARLIAPSETSRAEHIRLAEAQLEVVRARLARQFAKLGL